MVRLSEFCVLKVVVGLNVGHLVEGVGCFGALAQDLGPVLHGPLALLAELNDAPVQPGQLALPG